VVKCGDQSVWNSSGLRNYSSEYQFAQALFELMESGVIERKDFVLQTKVPPKATRKEFEAVFAQSWQTFGVKLGYIILFAADCISKKEQIEWILSDADVHGEHSAV